MTSNPTWFDLAVLEAVQFAPGGTVGAVGAVIKLSELSVDRRTVDARINGEHGWAAVVNCRRTARTAVGGCRRTVVITVITVVGTTHARAGLTAKSRDSASRPGTAIIIFICRGLRTDTQRTTPSRSGHAQMEIQIMHTPPSHFACLDGHYTHQQARRCVIAADLHDFCSLTRGFAALRARQPGPTSRLQPARQWP